MSRRGWSKEEIDIVIKYYPTEGIGVAKRLEGRTENQIHGIAWHHGIKNESRKKREANKYPRKKYTQEELDFIKNNFSEMDIQDIADELGRSINAIRSITFKMGLTDSDKKQNTWTDEEIAIIKEYFPTEGINVKERLPNRSIPAIYSEASHLGVALKKRNKTSSNSEWTEEEDEIIKKYYINESVEKCCELLPNRSRQAIIMRANRYLDLRKRTIRKWTEEEEKFLEEHYLTDGIDYCHKHLDRTKDSIFQKTIRMGLQKK